MGILANLVITEIFASWQIEKPFLASEAIILGQQFTSEEIHFHACLLSSVR